MWKPEIGAFNMENHEIDRLLKDLGRAAYPPINVERQVWTRLAMDHDGATEAFRPDTFGLGGAGILVLGQVFGWQGTGSLLGLAALIGFGAAGLTQPLITEPFQDRSAALAGWMSGQGPRAPSSILGE
jgi:hypothetical protein